MTSCDQDEKGRNGAGKGKPVSVQSETTPLTRAETSPVGISGVTFGECHLFCVSSTGSITKYMTISRGTTTDKLLLAEAISTGTNIDNVLLNSNRVFVMVNLPSDVTLPTISINQNISVVQALDLEIKHIDDDSVGITAVPLYSSGSIMESVYYRDQAKSEIRAVGPRTDLREFTPYGKIKSHCIYGIFPNYYYDHSNSGLGNLDASAKVHTPQTSGNVLGYNKFPTTSHHLFNIRLSKIKYTDDTVLADPQFLTVKGFTTSRSDFASRQSITVFRNYFRRERLHQKAEVGSMYTEI